MALVERDDAIAVTIEVPRSAAANADDLLPSFLRAAGAGAAVILIGAAIILLGPRAA